MSCLPILMKHLQFVQIPTDSKVKGIHPDTRGLPALTGVSAGGVGPVEATADRGIMGCDFQGSQLAEVRSAVPVMLLIGPGWFGMPAGSVSVAFDMFSSGTIKVSRSESLFEVCLEALCGLQRRGLLQTPYQ